MNRWLAMAFAAILALSIVGCGAGGDNASAMNNGTGPKYLIATDAEYAPMEYMDKGSITGFDIDFIHELMKLAGINYEFRHTGWDAMLEYVKQGKEYSMGVSSVSITEDRKVTYDYSSPYFESTNMILVKESSVIANALDLKDKKVAVQIETTAEDLMAGIMGSENVNLKRFDSNAVAILEMEKGGVDAVVADNAVVQEYVKHNPKKKFKIIEDPVNFDFEFYGILLPKGSELKAKLDPAIKKMLENGTYAKLYKKWFDKDPDLSKLLQTQ